VLRDDDVYSPMKERKREEDGINKPKKI